MKTKDFAKHAGVSLRALYRAISKGKVVRLDHDKINPKLKINADYIKANTLKRKNHKLAAKVAALKNSKSKKGKVNDSDERYDDSNDPEVKGYLQRDKLQQAKLAVETKLKQVELAKELKMLIPTKFVYERLSNFAKALHNNVLILPERISDEIVTIVLKKGTDARGEVAAFLVKNLASAIKESKKAIDAVTQYEMDAIRPK